MERVFVNIQRYGNMSAATVAVALCEAVEEGRVKPGRAAAAAGVRRRAELLRAGGALGSAHRAAQSCAVELPPNERSALELIAACLERKLTPSARTAADPFAGL